jgi:hypothetical protein
MAEHDPYRLPDDEPVNPYAAPQADLSPGPSYVPGPRGDAPFSASLVIGQAWEIFRDRLGVAWPIGVVPLAISWVYQIAVQAMAATVDQTSLTGLAAVVLLLISMVVLQVWLQLGQNLGLLRVARGEPASVGDLFRASGSMLLSWILATLIVGLGLVAAIVACMLPVGLAVVLLGRDSAASPVLLVVGFLIVVAVAILLGVRLSQFPYVIVDRNAGPIQALQTSWELTRGRTLVLFGLMIVAGLIAMSGIILCIVGLFFTVPLSYLLYACTYVALNGEVPGGIVLKRVNGHDPDFPEFSP